MSINSVNLDIYGYGSTELGVDSINGTATVSAGNTYVDTPHGLSFTPDINRFTLQPQSELGGKDFWISNVGASTIRINISSSDFSDLVFGWKYN